MSYHTSPAPIKSINCEYAEYLVRIPHTPQVLSLKHRHLCCEPRSLSLSTGKRYAHPFHAIHLVQLPAWQLNCAGSGTWECTCTWPPALRTTVSYVTEAVISTRVCVTHGSYLHFGNNHTILLIFLHIGDNWNWFVCILLWFIMVFMVSTVMRTTLIGILNKFSLFIP
jgi:hypothetical protein